MAGRDGRENLANHRTDRVCAIRRCTPLPRCRVRDSQRIIPKALKLRGLLKLPTRRYDSGF